MLRFYTEEKLSTHMEKTPEGFLVCYDVPITRIGTFEYKSSEVPIESSTGMVEIQRDEDEVFSPISITSFIGKPVTINHPSEFVTPDNWNELAHGHAQNVRRGEGEQSDLLLADLLITTSKAIELVDSGLREVSCGYDAEYEELGNGKGRQTGIVGNHIALVLRGRAGGRCAIQDGKPCAHCENCTWGKNNLGQEDTTNMKMKARDLFKKIFPKSKICDSIKDEDLGEPAEIEEGAGGDVEKAQAAAAEAKAAAEQAVAAAQQASEAAAAVAEGGEKPNPAEDDETGGGGNAEIIAMLTSVKELLEKLMAHENTEDELSPEDIAAKKKEEQEMKDAEAAQKKEDEELEGEFQDVAANAEIIDPDINLAKPTKDFKTFYQKVKKTALASALTGDQAPAIGKLLKGKTIDSLKDHELDGMFLAASGIIASTRDSKMQKSKFQKPKAGAKTGDVHSSAAEIADINAKNKAFWAKKGK